MPRKPPGGGGREPDILDRIVADRRRDLVRLGPGFGSSVPVRRERPLVPFLTESGAILEMKRASPSRGDIAPDLDAARTARAYARAGARNVSVLTEGNHFRGSLEDLAAASAAEPVLSYLRKDFLLEEEEIEVSWLFGADSVLLIARILSEAELRRMAAAARALGMRPLIEVRGPGDLAKLQAAASDGPVVSGVNARDLASFEIDLLAPAALVARLPGDAVFESGVRTPKAAAFARSLGFRGVLVGEAAARDPARAAGIVEAFRAARPGGPGAFWRAVAVRRGEGNGEGKSLRPLVKVCGLTRPKDALLAAELGADLLGFVFAESPRLASEDAVRETARRLGVPSGGSPAPGLSRRPLLVAVITEMESEPARTALNLARGGVVDAVQYHGARDAADLARLDALLEETEAGRAGGPGRYAAVGVADRDDLGIVAALRETGEPRVLADARAAGRTGGTGTEIGRDLVRALRAQGPLWLAGGLGPGTVGAALDAYRPELVDASSRLESEPGRKDPALLKSYFKEIAEHVG